MEGGVRGIVIVVSAFMIQVLTFGTSASIGVYNIELLDYFHTNTVGVSLIGAINFGVYLGSGPIVSYLMTKFSYRKIALLGSALVAVGLTGMPYFPYIPAMCLLFGVLTGFGNCCTYIPSHVLSGLYYEKYRSIATGISTSGSGLGSAVMPVLVGFLIDIYSWRGSLIFVAGLNLHLFIFTSLLRYPRDPVDSASAATPVISTCQAITSQLPHENSSSSLESAPQSATVGEKIKLCSTTPKISLMQKNSKEREFAKDVMREPQRPRSYVMSGSESYHGKTEYENSGASLRDSDCSDKLNVKTDKSSRGNLAVHLNQPVSAKVRSNQNNLIMRGTSEESAVRSTSQEMDTYSVIVERAYVKRRMASLISKQSKESDTTSSHAQDNERHSLVQFLSLPKSTSSRSLFALGSRGSTVIYYEAALHLADMQTSVISASSSGEETLSTSNITQKPISSRHVHIFKNYGFNIYFLSNIMWNSSYAIIQCFAPEFLKERGLTLMEAAFLSGAFGFSSFVGGIAGGFLGNIEGLNRQRVYITACLLMGGATLAFPLGAHVQVFAVTLVTAGLSLGIILGLLIVVLIDLIGVESLGNGLGYLMLSNGMGTFLGPPMASILRDKTGGFSAGMFLAGVQSVLGGLVMLLMPCRRSCQAPAQPPHHLATDCCPSSHVTRHHDSSPTSGQNVRNSSCQRPRCLGVKRKDVSLDFELVPR